ncbi:MAG: 50S ribosomal protein L19 [Candidatus Omnitrophica bacterium]|nr:50S ribosomal protein L19 [Candidatus Omnitrophota bacterium]
MATKINTGEFIKKLDQKRLRSDLPEFNVGDTVKMKVRVQEAEKMRLHPYEGIVIRKTSGKGLKAAFTVRKISFGEGVERTFPLHSPVIESLKVVAEGTVNRSRLYYLRNRQGKSARIEQEQTLTQAPTHQ